MEKLARIVSLVRSGRGRFADRANAESAGSLARKFPWIELIATAIGTSVLHFGLRNDQLAGLFALAGLLVGIGRLGYTAELERAVTALREPLSRIGEYLDISREAEFGGIRHVLEAYGQIVEPEFSTVKRQIVADARNRLLFLANNRRSETLPTTIYYDWLLPMLEKAVSSEKILALSMMRSVEWDTSQLEKSFIDLSSAAATRGVDIDRVFVFPKEIAHDLKNLPALNLHWHEREPKRLRGFVVEEETVKRSDADLFRRLGDGFIAFGARVALVDVFSETGAARGYLTMNEAEIEGLLDVHRRLHLLSEPMDTYFKSRSDHGHRNEEPLLPTKAATG